jgi:membrane fusion protein (multidrug efflux system)
MKLANLARWMLATVLCLAILAALGYYKYAEIRAGIEEGEAYPEQSETVEVAIVTAVDYRPELTVFGQVVAPQRLDLSNEIAGEIASVNFEPGQAVSEGQILIQLDTSIELANLEAARARANLARLTLERSAELFGSGLSNEEQVDRARADLATAEAAIEVLERTIQKMTLRAPFSGRAGLHEFEPGQFLPANTLITNLVGATDYVWVDFRVPQFYRHLAPGTDLRVTEINNEAVTHAMTATVIAENTILDARSRSRSYRARLPGSATQIAANTIVNVRVPTGETERLLQVPTVAMQNDPLGQFVYRLRDDESGEGMRAVRQRVELRAVEDEYALLETGRGLAEGDRIAGAGAFKLYENILVFAGERTMSSAGATDSTAAR